MSKHTKEPWAWSWSRKDEANIITSNNLPDEECLGACFCDESISDEERDANSERIVACVNACEGIKNPDAVPEMLKALKQLVGAINTIVLHKGIGKQNADYLWGIIDEAIAKAGSEKL